MALIDFDCVALDVPDLQVASEFYRDLLDGRIVRTDDDWAIVQTPTGVRIAFQLSPDHVPPTWPDPAVPQQIHLDFWVEDYGEPEARALRLGARKVDESHPGFRVYVDPAGHPFCLCLRSNAHPLDGIAPHND